MSHLQPPNVERIDFITNRHQALSITVTERMIWGINKTSPHQCVMGDIKAHQVLLNKVPEQATEDSV